MKSLVVKSLIVISAIAVTSALAWSKAPAGPCADGAEPVAGTLCNPNEPALRYDLYKPADVTESGTGKVVCRECEKAANQARLHERTAAAQPAAAPRPASPAKPRPGTR